MPAKKVAPEPAPAEKDPKPQGTLQAMAAGFSIKSEPGLSTMDRFVPAFVGLVHLMVLVSLAFPRLGMDPLAAAAILAFTGPIAAGMAGKLGAKPAK